MNRELRELFDKNNIVIKKITIAGGVIIVDNKYVIKKKNESIESIYRYLSGRNFDNYPLILFETDNYDVFEYIDETNLPNEEKASDIMKLLSKLHSKTTFYRDVDDDYLKEIFEEYLNRLDYLYNYYDDMANVIDGEEYMSPSNYLFVRNISLLFQVISYCKNGINKWYDIVKEKKRIRIVNIHNNISLDHYLFSDKPYFISWNKSKRDMPIFDIIIFYKRYYSDFDFCDLLGIYESYYPLLEEERILLLCMICLPSKLELSSSEYDSCLEVDSFYKYLSCSFNFVNDYDSKNSE